MGRSKPGKVALIAVLIAMLVGFARLDHRSRPPDVPPRPKPFEEEPVDPGPSAGLESDPVSQFLTDLVSVDANDHATDGVDDSPPLAFPLIGELPPLPEAYWPSTPLFTQAFPRRSRLAAY